LIVQRQLSPVTAAFGGSAGDKKPNTPAKGVGFYGFLSSAGFGVIGLE
jgi:hypothetical protein